MKPNTTPAPYGHGSSYTPATDGCAKPFVPAADRYSPKASNETTPTGRPVTRPQVQQFPLTK
jgi:hypothetical protein